MHPVLRVLIHADPKYAFVQITDNYAICGKKSKNKWEICHCLRGKLLFMTHFV